MLRVFVFGPMTVTNILVDGRKLDRNPNLHFPLGISSNTANRETYNCHQKLVPSWSALFRAIGNRSSAGVLVVQIEYMCIHICSLQGYIKSLLVSNKTGHFVAKHPIANSSDPPLWNYWCGQGTFPTTPSVPCHKSPKHDWGFPRSSPIQARQIWHP